MSDFKAKMHQVRYIRRGSTPVPVVGVYSAPLDPLAVLKGPISKGRKGEGGKGKVKVKGREGERRGSGGRDFAHPKIVAWRPYDLAARKVRVP